MKTIFIHIGISMLLALTALAQLNPGQQNKNKGTERIGIYDSRAIAVAYAGSPFLGEKMKGLTNRLKIAREAGDTKEITRLEAEGQAWQATLHQQGFGTAPVDDILAHIASELPEIQRTAMVTSLVSKWNKAALDKHPKAEHIDVTMRLVDAFKPNETQRKRAIEIQKIQPQKLKDQVPGK